MAPVTAVVAGSGYLRPDAKKQYDALNAVFTARWGKPLSITEGYRPLARQDALFRERYFADPAGTIYYAGQRWKLRPGQAIAAVPGTSNHGWGTACDFGAGVNLPDSAEKNWMDATAPNYGYNPTVPSEAWHFDYTRNYTPINEGPLMALSDSEQTELLTKVRALAGFLYSGGSDATAGRFDGNSVIGRIKTLQDATFFGGTSMQDDGKPISQSLAEIQRKLP